MVEVGQNSRRELHEHQERINNAATNCLSTHGREGSDQRFPRLPQGREAAARDPENLLVRICFQDGRAQLSAPTVN